MTAPVPVGFVRLADQALASGTVAIGDGVIAVPDLMIVEGIAHRLPVTPTYTLIRADGRTVAFYRRPRGCAA